MLYYILEIGNPAELKMALKIPTINAAPPLPAYVIIKYKYPIPLIYILI